MFHKRLNTELPEELEQEKEEEDKRLKIDAGFRKFSKDATMSKFVSVLETRKKDFCAFVTFKTEYFFAFKFMTRANSSSKLKKYISEDF